MHSSFHLASRLGNNGTIPDLATSFQSYYDAERRAAKRSQRNVDQRAARVRELVEFFKAPQTRTAPFPLLISFLAMRGFCRSEMEDALGACEQRQAEYDVLLRWTPGTELDALEQKPQAYSTAGAAAAASASATTTKTAGAPNPGSPPRSPSPTGGGGSGAPRNNTQQQNQELYQLWRVGGTVFVYLGHNRYAPVPLESVEFERLGDILGVDAANVSRFDPRVRKLLANPNAPLCCQGTRNLRYFAPGYKGAGTNQCATADLVHEGMQLLVADPDCEMGTFCEATVLAVRIDVASVNDDPTLVASATYDTLEVDSSDDDKATSFTLDVEWAHNGKRLSGVFPDDTRLFTHADVLRAEQRHRRDQLRAARKGQRFSVDKQTSLPNFPVSGAALLDEQGERASGHALRAIKLNRQTRDRGAQLSNLPEHMMRGFVKNFARFPHLADTDAEPAHCRTAAEFLSHFGESKGGGAGGGESGNSSGNASARSDQQDTRHRRGFPLFPDCQRLRTGIGFGFDTSTYPRHPRSHVHLTLNPLVDVATQCTRRNRKFIDPDFPPTFKSLFGLEHPATGEIPPQLPPIFSRDPAHIENDVMWRRLSDVFFRPRMHVVGSSPAHLKLGCFTPPWLECVVLSLCRNQDLVDELISPGEDGWVYGAYVVRLLVEGNWHYVLVDDFVPCHPKTGKPLCFLSGKDSEIYTAIVEKALAKVEGSYAGLYLSLRPEVTPGRVWNDLSGYVHDVIEHDCVQDKRNVCENLLGLVNEEAGDVAPLHVQARSYGDELGHLCRFGFERGSWWHVDCAVRFWDPPNDSIFFYRVFRGEHVGHAVNAATLQAAVFDGIDTAVLAELPSNVPCDSTVSFWVDGARFFDIFERTIVLREMRNSHKATFEGTFAGRPHAGAPSAGPRPFFSNPQLFFSVVQAADIIMNLELRDRRLNGGPGADGTGEPLSKDIVGEALQLYVMHTHPVEEPITPAAQKENPSIYYSVAFSQPARVRDDEDARAYPVVTLRVSLQGGCFVLIPTLAIPSNEEFTLNVFSTASFQISRLN